MNYQKYSFLALRLGLAATYVYSGLDLISHPTAWISFVPSWLSQALPITTKFYLQIQGSLELLLAGGFLFGVMLPTVSFLAALEMFFVLVFYGTDQVSFRDLAILGAALSVFLATFKKFQSTNGSS